MQAITYPPSIARLIERRPSMRLDAGTPDPAVVEELDSALLERLFGKEIIHDRTAARLCLAGLWLLYDHLDECHSIAQSIETPDGSYWHAIVHRREGDFSNSKSWYRRVGDHPIFPIVATNIHSLITHPDDLKLTMNPWDPFTFVDLCEAAIRRKHDALCRQIQMIEWKALFDHCFRKAVG